jgi:type III secretory pathway component EscV
MTSFTVATNSKKYLGLALTKHMKDLYDKNFKSLKKEMKKTSEVGKMFHAHR